MAKASILLPIQHSFLDYPNPIEGCLSIFMTGCAHNCSGCQNSDLWSIDNTRGTSLDSIEMVDILRRETKKWRTNKIVLMGGDPLFSTNLIFTKELLDLVKLENYEVVLYTGYDVDFVRQNNVVGWEYLKCGKYDESQKVLSEKTSNGFQLASRNQVIYDREYNQLTDNGFMKF